jgi:hypothetical protein
MRAICFQECSVMMHRLLCGQAHCSSIIQDFAMPFVRQG